MLGFELWLKIVKLSGIFIRGVVHSFSVTLEPVLKSRTSLF